MNPSRRGLNKSMPHFTCGDGNPSGNPQGWNVPNGFAAVPKAGCGLQTEVSAADCNWGWDSSEINIFLDTSYMFVASDSENEPSCIFHALTCFQA